MPPFVHYLVYIIPIYFGFAVGYDIYNTIRDIVIEQSGTSQGKVITQGITGVAKNLSKVVTNLTENVLTNTTLTSVLNLDFTSVSPATLTNTTLYTKNLSDTSPLL